METVRTSGPSPDVSSGQFDTPKGGNNMMDLLSKLQREEEGQTMAEYAVVLAVITLLVVVALTSLSDAIVAALDQVTGIIG